MHLIKTAACIAALHFGLTSAASAQDIILVKTPASVAPGLHVPAKVMQECPADQLLGNAMLEQVLARFPDAQPFVDEASVGNNKVLNLVITGIIAAAGGSWSGSKSMNVEATLTQNGKVIGKTTRMRKGGGGFGMFGVAHVRGTFTTVERVSIALAKDISKWLSNPTIEETAVVEPVAAASEAAPGEK